MTQSGSITGWIIQLQQHEDSQATTEIWQHFSARVLRLARAKLQNRGLVIADEEDVACVVFRSLFSGIAKGRFPSLKDRNDLWALLIRMTERKAVDLIRHEGRQKRPAIRSRGDQQLHMNSSIVVWSLAQIADERPDPIDEMMLVEECSLLLMRLEDPVLISIAQLKLAGQTNREISSMLCRPLRTVERKLALIRSIWSSDDGR